MGGIDFNPDRDIPSLEDKVILITGGNIGLGRQSALALSKHNPSQLWLAARNVQKTEKTIADIQKQAPGVAVHFLELDLGSFDSVKKAAKTFLSSVTRLDLLFLNAGIMAVPAGVTREGYEIQFGTNHMGHALLLKFLVPLLVDTATKLSSTSNVRVVVLSSLAHKYTVSGGIDFNTLKNQAEVVSTVDRYGQSKLANGLYAREMSKRYPQFTIVSVHPGAVKTDLNKSNGGSTMLRLFQALVLPFIGVTPEEGAKCQLWAATATNVISGEYYEPIGVLGKGSPLMKNDELGRKLWEWTEKELERHVV
ncbi:NAD(P)-binding protein [Pleurostoma richardsiae]|uniref:NAD(P)-binding protein n=1 Tax=Pleurostoma richardsiae TaxID=41990 RepID=A0AA38REX0_9PEZI|nr:NAD(P)-binding protein [Pleurostoma richardsiae]